MLPLSDATAASSRALGPRATRTVAVSTRPVPGAVAAVAVVGPRAATITTAPAPALPRLTRHRGGTYSPTVETIRFTDGSLARTDLVRLNPNIDAYSVDFTGRSSAHSVQYRPLAWRESAGLRARFRATEISRILAASYPMVGTSELSDRVRRAGYRIGRANLREHQAIAGTQAALWKLTNDLDLDVGDRAVPAGVRAPSGATASIDSTGAIHARIPVDDGGRAHLDIEFDGPRQLAGFALYVTTNVPGAELEIAVQRSADGATWARLPQSRSATAGSKADDYRLPLLATAGGEGGGYRHFRLDVVARDRRVRSIEISGLRFRIGGSAPYANDLAVVGLYRYLLEQSARDVRPDAPPTLNDTAARYDTASGLFGPLWFDGPHPALPSASVVSDGLASGSGATDIDVVDTRGRRITSPIASGRAFFVAGLHHGDAVNQVRVRLVATRGGVAAQLLLADRHERLTPLVTPRHTGYAVVTALRLRSAAARPTQAAIARRVG